MELRRLVSALLIAFAPFIASACGNDDDEEPRGECTVGDNSTCKDGLVCQNSKDGPKCFCSIDTSAGCDANKNQFCEATVDGTNGCFAPLSVTGRVFNLSSDAPIEGARVVARDANNAAQSGVAVTAADGTYSLRVAAMRNADGTIAASAEAITLRADAAGFQTFPTPPRVALAVDLTKATSDSNGNWSVSTVATDIGLIPLANATGLGTIRGKVEASAPRGTLIVAGGSANAGGGVTGVADFDGTYAVFNVPAGNVTVHGYKAGLQLDSATASVTAGQTTEGVNLHAIDKPTWNVSGKVDIVNPGNGSDTSVILVVDETFDPNAIHGEAPPGLRVSPVSGEFTIAGVPDGNFVVLAAFENDFLVRDPDTAIGGTQILHIQVAGDQAIQSSFKVTGSLDNVSPDAEQVVSGTPTFYWDDDSSEEGYEIRVFDALGTKVWEKLDIKPFTGSGQATTPYAGTALQSGMIYQFRVLSYHIDNKGVHIPISATEDLRGTFRYQ